VAGALAVPAAAGAVTLQGAGSSAEQPILQNLFSTYSKLHKKIRFTYNADGGNAGVKQVQSHRALFAVNTRPPLKSDAGTTYIKIFLDGLCVDVNPKNSLSNLSITNTANIFLGLDTTWSQVTGSNLGSATIEPVGRASTAGSYTFFQSAVLNGKTQASSVEQEGSDGQVATKISEDSNAIGYVGLAHSHGAGVKTLEINGVGCNTATIKNESYPLWRWIWAVIPTPSKTQRPNAQVEQFINWVATSSKAGSVISKAGAVPAFNK
jgi:phosphate transport system substrate-binding protein